MRKLIAAHTTSTEALPGYVNISEDEDAVVVTVRGDPSTRKGVNVCGHARDHGAPGRCTPGDDRCNNYCNMAPAKGPMQSAPLPCETMREGATAQVRLTPEAWASLKAAISA